MVNGSLLLAGRNSQPTIAQPTCEAEYVSANYGDSRDSGLTQQNEGCRIGEGKP